MLSHILLSAYLTVSILCIITTIFEMQKLKQNDPADLYKAMQDAIASVKDEEAKQKLINYMESSINNPMLPYITIAILSLMPVVHIWYLLINISILTKE